VSLKYIRTCTLLYAEVAQASVIHLMFAHAGSSILSIAHVE